MAVAGRRGSVEGRRRSPRRLPKAVVLAMVSILLVVVGHSIVSSSAEGPDPSLEFADRVRPAVDRSTRQAGALEELRSSVGALGRDGVQKGVDRLVKESNALVAEVSAVPAAGKVRETQGLLLTCLTTRGEALTTISATVKGKFETGPPEAAVDALVTAGRDLAVSDRAYALFLRRLPAKARQSMPPSVWLSDPTRFDQPEMASFVGTLRAQASLVPVRDLTIVTVTTDPAPVATDGANRVLPLVKQLKLQVVVANAGTMVEKRVPIEAVVTSQGGVDTARQFVDLGPGQRMTVALTLRPSPLGVLEVKVRAGPLEGEASIADNENVATYIMR